MTLPWPNWTREQWQRELANGRLLTLRREREAIHLDLWYVANEQMPGATGEERARLERRKHELERRLADVDYQIEKWRLP